MVANHVAGVIIRSSNGVKVDPMLATYMTDAKAAGLPVGVYHFINPKVGTAVSQGEMLAAAHNAWACDLPPMLDVENYANEAGPASAAIYGPPFAAWLHTMVDTVTALTGRDPLIYTNAAYWNPSVNDATFGHLDLVCARYPFYSPAACAAHVPPVDARDWDEWVMAATAKRPQVPRGWNTWQAWQFSAGYNGRGHTYGASSADLDLNIARDDAWQRWTAKPPPEDDMQTLPTPLRVYDSRTAGGALAAGETRTVALMAAVAGVNITVAAADRPGYLTAWGADPKPGTSNVQFGIDLASDNFAQVVLAPGGILHFSASAACHVIIDLQAAG